MPPFVSPTHALSCGEREWRLSNVYGLDKKTGEEGKEKEKRNKERE
jgi:hypothetical protein